MLYYIDMYNYKIILEDSSVIKIKSSKNLIVSPPSKLILGNSIIESGESIGFVEVDGRIIYESI